MTIQAGSIEYTASIDTKSSKAQLDGLRTSTKKVEAEVKKFDAQVTKSSQGVKKAMTANLGQAGIQVQQFVGQIQGGQSAMVALAQQGADLGIVLGAPLVGVFVSLAAVAAGTLAPAIFKSLQPIVCKRWRRT